MFGEEGWVCGLFVFYFGDVVVVVEVVVDDFCGLW